jgi:hypothetical protein
MVGLVEVILEDEDYEFYLQQEVDSQLDNLKRVKKKATRQQVYLNDQASERQESNVNYGSGRNQTLTPVISSFIYSACFYSLIISIV